jgi:energy-coupling factor transporter ATP-binding protein EcfA2
MTVIEIQHLHKQYGAKVAVDDVSFSVEEGEIFGVLGPNGAGKTTTVECVEGLRARGILRRLDTTPVGAGRVLGAQLLVNLGVALSATIGLLTVGRAAFGVALPRQFAGSAVSLVLVASAMLALGLLIAALAPNARVAGAVGAIVFLPMMFFAGLWTPQATMPEVVRQIGAYTPLGAAVQAIQDSMVGRWPHLWSWACWPVTPLFAGWRRPGFSGGTEG